MSHVTPGRACHMLPRGVRVTCYPGAPIIIIIIVIITSIIIIKQRSEV